MAKVIGVRFRNTGKSYYFDPDGKEISVGTDVIVETAQGQEIGRVTMAVKEVNEEQIVAPLKKVVRVATRADERKAEENAEKEARALEIAEEKAAAKGLEMKFIRVEYAFDGTKGVFFFTSEGRVDFRELVKELASAFHMRIELRQIGVRDETKLLGGLGPCGQPCCCNRFLGGFQPVSIKMAKEQGLSLNPTKISGLCGRLMCCLKYEQDTYEKAHRKMPSVGAEVKTADGVGRVQEVNALKETVKVTISNGDQFEVREFPYTEVQVTRPFHRRKENESSDSLSEDVPETEELPASAPPEKEKTRDGRGKNANKEKTEQKEGSGAEKPEHRPRRRHGHGRHNGNKEQSHESNH
ncbi:MAG: stage 0 sporulation family protein [Clostridia bacterium]|nr:stage 0 sporulation family protein [Clostridia bacterium]